jgi:hypothetical protein
VAGAVGAVATDVTKETRLAAQDAQRGYQRNKAQAEVQDFLERSNK